MQHLPILPVLIPMLVAVLMLLPPFSTTLNRQRAISFVGVIATLAVSIQLILIADSGIINIYQLGNWQAPFGIVLIADRLSSLMILLTMVLAFGALLYGVAADDRTGMFFYPLFMFQLMGINGAFLTGDIFNLFVFFEVLLLASYALVVHGGGKQKTLASVHYVTLNLIGSALFLFALGIMYGVLGTLNIADMAVKVRTLSGADKLLAQVGGMMLLLVFGLKSAMFPLHFWLSRTYSSVSAPVAALFAIMTKVGIYSILRIFTVVFGDHAGELANLAGAWLWPIAILTIAIGAIGALASQTLRMLVSNLVIVSVGTMLCALAINTPESAAAALYYLIHSTLITGAMFLLADAIAEQRGKVLDRFARSRRMCQSLPLGIAFSLAAVSMIGLPPFSGFLGKVMILQTAVEPSEIAWAWSAILIASLMGVIAMSRGGSTMFWRVGGEPNFCEMLPTVKLVAVFFLLAMSPLLVIFGGQITEFTTQTATQIYQQAENPHMLLPSLNTKGG
ncbi:monovalent cation/H+ antiporter subunit D [Neptuniibacter caesariensis]|uniref:NADH dehydrogenase subunit N n=1 Tax=Neptuniibacter caesariensis TaxID=207954 RepID=A0A7U8C426_NEPCE|nr:monovalent cation/H+ antiporter subunit D [Neptuniibacter caesariensis]EAR60854.1 NADH dehydrogenase subunit N [Oceanospirillum sp. MED92] [Neptuniibacter caesariensis]